MDFHYLQIFGVGPGSMARKIPFNFNFREAMTQRFRGATHLLPHHNFSHQTTRIPLHLSVSPNGPSFSTNFLEDSHEHQRIARAPKSNSYTPFSFFIRLLFLSFFSSSFCLRCHHLCSCSSLIHFS